MAEKIRDYAKLATDIIELVGGEKNIQSATRCATRLRLVLRETPPDAKQKVSERPGVISVIERGGQFQVVIGTHVSEVYESLASNLQLGDSSSVVAPVKESIINRIIATMSAVFAPVVYILAAAGLLQGILIIITMAWPGFVETGTYSVLSFISWSSFSFLPIFIAVTGSKHFNCNTYIAIACCAALISPSWAEIASKIANGEIISFLGIPLTQTVYTSSVLPPLLLVWFLSYLQRFVEKIIPAVVRQLLTPLVCIVIMVPLTILIIGPISNGGAIFVAQGYNWLVSTVPALAAAVVGGLWQLLVVFGVHWGITPMNMANFAQHGSDSFQAFQSIAVIAQVGAALGVAWKSRNKQMKGVATSAGITGVFGITEPAIYGVTLRLKKPFICGCVAGAIGAVVLSIFGTRYYAYAGLPGLLTTVNAINPEHPGSFIGAAIGAGIGLIGAFILVQFVGFNDPTEEKA